MAANDPRQLPNYPLTEAAQWLAIKPGKLRSWLVGKKFKTAHGARWAAPLVRPAQAEPLVLSFWNLVECSVLASMRGRLDPEFITAAGALNAASSGNLAEASDHAILAIRQAITAAHSRIECDAEGLAARLFPWRRSPEEPKVVSIDPRIAFGQPVLVGTRVPVQVVFDRFRAGDRLADLAAEYRADPGMLEEAVRAWIGPPAA